VPTLGLVCAVALSGVFAVSGVAKLADREGTRQAVAGFGVRASRVNGVAAVLAPAELLVALALVVPASNPAGLILALLLLSGFTRAVALAMLAGRRPECHCFGRIGGADISQRTVARNIALAVIAVVGIAARGGSWGELGAGRLVGAVAAGLAIAAAVVGAEGLAGRSARARRDRAADRPADRAADRRPGPGDPAPAFALPTLAGPVIGRDDLLTEGRPVLVVFLSPACERCLALWPEVQRRAAASGALRVAVIVDGDDARSRTAFGNAAELPVLLDVDGAVRAAFGVAGTPAAVLVGGDGRFQGPRASGEGPVRGLLEDVGRPASPAAARSPRVDP
jgi:peroxiredoxin